MPQTLQRKQVQVTKAKRRPGALPVRLTSCIFQKPVTRITSHPDNDVRCRQWEEKLQKPQQVSAYRRLQGLQACNSEGELLSPFDFESAFNIIVPGIPGEPLGQAGAGVLHTCPEPTIGRSSDWAEGVLKSGLGLSQPLCRQQVTPGDIQRQIWKVRKARKRLAEALRADRLAREAERAMCQGE
ncbi:putative methyl-CpG-binding domain protein 3-like 3 [Cynocephalus volans]|uniref:putative methyl-CpG-binding domain protein 3-like 3 n=1 Tax=Cynocephalus volans TaxID=110931 RepID=UPI002FC5A585